MATDTDKPTEGDDRGREASEYSGWSNALIVEDYQPPPMKRRQRLYWWFRKTFRWPQCRATHSPYRHWTDEQCRRSFLCSNDANKKIWHCMRRRGHIGKHQDIHGERW